MKHPMDGLVVDHLRCFGSEALVCSVHAYKRYVNGQPTEEIEGFKYVCMFSKRPFQCLSVKIEGSQILEVDGNWIRVIFDQLCVKTYVDPNGTLRLSAKAKGLQRLDN